MDCDSAPNWDQVLSWLAHPSQLEAIGAMALTHNALEFSLYGLLEMLLADEVQAIQLFHMLNNRQKVDLIKSMIQDSEEPFRSNLEYALKGFDICVENRNLIVHAMSESLDVSNSDQLLMVKANKNRPGDFTEYAFPLLDIRAASVSAYATMQYIEWITENSPRTMNDDWPPAWPERPLAPRKLSLFQRREDRANDQSPPLP